MNLGIVGSRNYNNYQQLEDIVLSRYDIGTIDSIVTGDANGADALARRFAHAHHLNLIVKVAEWGQYGKSAGPRRNQLIVNDSDEIIAFPCSTSKGTFNTMRLAKQANKPLEVIYVDI